MSDSPVIMKKGAVEIPVVSPEHYYNLLFDGFAPLTKAGVPAQMSAREVTSAHGVQNFRSVVHFRKGTPGVRVTGAGDAVSLTPRQTLPDPAALGRGTQIYDDVSGMPLWSDGTAWLDAFGNESSTPIRG